MLFNPTANEDNVVITTVNDTVNLTCSLSRGAPYFRVVWTFRNKKILHYESQNPLNYKGKRLQGTSDKHHKAHLIISSVTFDDAGQYKCAEYSSTAGLIIPQFITLHVQGNENVSSHVMSSSY